MTTELSVDVIKQEYIDTLTALIKATKEEREALSEERKKAVEGINERSYSLRRFQYYLEDCACNARPVAFMDLESYIAYREEVDNKSKSEKELEDNNSPTIYCSSMFE